MKKPKANKDLRKEGEGNDVVIRASGASLAFKSRQQDSGTSKAQMIRQAFSNN